MSVVLIGSYPPPFGGEAVHVADLARQLRAYGTYVRVVNPSRSATASAEYDKISSIFDLLRTVNRRIRDASIVHVHTNGHSIKSWSLVFLVGLVLRWRKRAGVLTLHSGLGPTYLKRAGALQRAFARTALARFTRIICVNGTIREALASVGVDTRRCSVIPAYLGVPVTLETSSSDLCSIDGFKPYIAAAAGDGPEYGIPILLEAVGRLRRSFPGVGCVLMGSGSNAKTRAAVVERGLHDRVRCLGDVPRERYLALVSRADVFVRPSLEDGDSISVREALALGRPVVASDVGNRPDGVVLFRRGDPTDLAEKISSVLKAPCHTRGILHHNYSFEQIVDVYRAHQMGEG